MFQRAKVIIIFESANKISFFLLKTKRDPHPFDAKQRGLAALVVCQSSRPGIAKPNRSRASHHCSW